MKTLKIALILTALLIALTSLILTAGPRPKCKGLTVKNLPCKSIMVNKAGFCRAHDPKAVRCGALKSDKKPCKMIVSKAGQKCRYHS